MREREPRYDLIVVDGAFRSSTSPGHIIYADYCLSHQHYDPDLELVEPVIAEFDAWLQRTVVEPPMKQIYEEQLDNLKFRRDGLIALRAGGAEAEAWLARDEARRNSP